MLKVLIADDEKKICLLVKHLVDWEALGFEIVEIVHDGKAAYEYVRNHPVDVMITDIRMPEYNGIELIQKLKSIRPEIHLIIVSGYSQFAYAQNAIRYGVEDYLLKPVRQKELHATLSKILDKQKVKNESQEEKQILKQKITEEKQKLKKKMLNDILDNPDLLMGAYTREQVMEEFTHGLACNIYQVAVIKPMLPYHKDNEEPRRILLNKSLQIIESNMSGVCREIVCTISNNSIYCVFNDNQDGINEIHQRMKKVRREILYLKDLFQNIKVYMALGETTDSFYNIHESVESARKALYNRFLDSNEVFLVYQRQPEKEKMVRLVLNNRWKKHFLNHVEMIDTLGLGADIVEVVKSIEGICLVDASLIYLIYKELLDLFYFGVNKYGITISTQYDYLVHAFEYFYSLHDVFGFLKDCVTDSLLEWSNQRKLADSRPIREARQYILENYYRQLTLETVSRQIGLHPNYFSSIFKKEVNKNFSDYLIEVRIDNAKQLILNTNNTIISIAETVGYSDIKYFSKLFKKIMGLSPTEFRKLYN